MKICCLIILVTITNHKFEMYQKMDLKCVFSEGGQKLYFYMYKNIAKVVISVILGYHIYFFVIRPFITMKHSVIFKNNYRELERPEGALIFWGDVLIF